MWIENSWGAFPPHHRTDTFNGWRAEQELRALAAYFASFDYAADRRSGPTAACAVSESRQLPAHARHTLARPHSRRRSAWEAPGSSAMHSGGCLRRRPGRGGPSPNNKPTTIVGVLPRNFDFDRSSRPVARSTDHPFPDPETANRGHAVRNRACVRGSASRGASRSRHERLHQTISRRNRRGGDFIGEALAREVPRAVPRPDGAVACVSPSRVNLSNAPARPRQRPPPRPVRAPGATRRHPVQAPRPRAWSRLAGSLSAPSRPGPRAPWPTCRPSGPLLQDASVDLRPAVTVGLTTLAGVVCAVLLAPPDSLIAATCCSRPLSAQRRALVGCRATHSSSPRSPLRACCW